MAKFKILNRMYLFGLDVRLNKAECFETDDKKMIDHLMKEPSAILLEEEADEKKTPAEEKAPEAAAPGKPEESEPDWSYMTKTQLVKWLSSAGLDEKTFRGKGKQFLVDLAKNAWKDGLRG